MIHIQNFKDKIKELERAKEEVKKLTTEANIDVTEMKKMIVQILDEILYTANKKEMSLKVKININNKNIFKIDHDIEITANRDLGMHLNGINTRIHWNENNIKDNIDLLWNLTAGGKNSYDEIVNILDYLMTKYNKYYKAVLMKQTTNKYNL